MAGRRSVDLNQEDFEVVLDLIQKELDAEKDEYEKNYYEKLLNRVKATPSEDNPVVFGYQDLALVRSQAKTAIVDMPMNQNLSGKQLELQESAHIALANSLFMWLNRENNLKRVVLFDFQDDTYQYESNDE